MITYNDFRRVDMRVGRVLVVEDFPEARKPSYKLTIDFGPEIGVKKSSAQITGYREEELVGRLVIGVINFPPKKIADSQSEVLTLGVADRSTKDNWFIIQPDRTVELGTRVE
ncbi:MAG: tRNA-binding protein [Candidatus Bathyarchaeota archaeon]|nr:MAG: tRNA-binding protein [Candidatus Bathyarchaeota archaeon]